MMRDMSSIHDVISRIRAYRIEQGWSIHRLGREAGVGESTIRRMDSADWNPTRDILHRLEAVIPENWHPGEEAA